MSSLRARAAAAVLSAAVLTAACGGGSETATSVTSENGQAVATAPAVATTTPLDAPVEAAISDEATPALPEPSTDEPAAETSLGEPAAEAPADPSVAATSVPAPAAITIALPAVDVVNLANGQTTSLNSLAEPGATLLWFWAPH